MFGALSRRQRALAGGTSGADHGGFESEHGCTRPDCVHTEENHRRNRHLFFFSFRSLPSGTCSDLCRHSSVLDSELFA